MCIIDAGFYDASGQVQSISNTRICAFLCKDGAHQLTVYSNSITVRNAAPVAMILPVPCGEINLVNTSEDPDGGRMFGALGELFEDNEDEDDDEDAPRAFSNRNDRSQSTLPVHVCGSYNYTVVPTIHDFHRLNTDRFMRGATNPSDPTHPKGPMGPTPAVMALLRREYAKGFSFLVCMIRAGQAYHPIAYTHPVRGGALFVPTMHWHGHEEQGNPRWDHTIYVLGAAADDDFGEPSTCTPGDAKALPWKVPLCYAQHMPHSWHPSALRRRTVVGRGLPNLDITVRAAAL